MTKSEYMEALQKKLECFNRELQQEIVEDYEQHFAEGIAAGKTEEEIVAELGSIEDMIQELPEEDLGRDDMTIRVPEGPEIHISGITGAGQPEEAEGKGNADSACPEGNDISKVYPGGYRRIVIDGAIADVSIKPSSDGQIHTEYKNKGNGEYRVYQYEEEGVFYVGIRRDKEASARDAKRAVKIMLFGKTLNVDLDRAFDFGRDFNGIWSNNGGITLNIRIPAEMSGVEVKTLSGDIRVTDVNLQQLNINSTSGDIEIRHVTVDRLKLNTTSGDIMVNQLSGADVEMYATSGDVELMEGDIGVFRLRTANGDFSGRYVSGNSMTVRTGSGDVELDGRFERYDIGTGSGDVDFKAGAGAAQIHVRTGSGDVELDVTALDSTEVTVSTGSGEAVIYSAGDVKHQVTGGTGTVGSGDCKVHVSTGSGDAEVRRR